MVKSLPSRNDVFRRHLVEGLKSDWVTDDNRVDSVLSDLLGVAYKEKVYS